MLFSKETLRAFGQSKGIGDIEDEALQILAQDVEYRVKELCQEASKFMLASHRTKLTVSDVNYALISRNVEPLFGYDAKESLVFRGLPCNVYYIPDEEVDLEEYIEKPLPRVPLKPYIQSHWLAIEGVQPPIQQNPTIVEKGHKKLDTLALYQEQMELKQQHRHLLTKELSLYFDRIIQSIHTNPSIAIDCLKNEAGIQQLVPYFVHHFKVELGKNMSNEKLVSTLLKIFLSLLQNKFIFIDPYIHEILPALLSCIVNISASDNTKHLASHVVKYVYETFSMKYTNLPHRIINLLKNIWLDEKKTEAEQHGALLCLSLLSSTVFETHILPNINSYKGDHKKVLDLIRDLKTRESSPNRS